MKKKKNFYYYALQFEFDCEKDDDTIYFSFCQPYTYTQIMKDVSDREALFLNNQS